MQPFRLLAALPKFALSLLRAPSRPSAKPAPNGTAKAAPSRASATIDPATAARLARALSHAYEAVIAALDPKVVDFDACEQRDKEAATSAEALQATYEATASGLPDSVKADMHVVLERIERAQLQIMAFAINRKNRGEVPPAETDAERRDRNEFRREIEPAYRALMALLEQPVPSA